MFSLIYTKRDAPTLLIRTREEQDDMFLGDGKNEANKWDQVQGEYGEANNLWAGKQIGSAFPKDNLVLAIKFNSAHFST